jgi:hypothetical protein
MTVGLGSSACRDVEVVLKGGAIGEKDGLLRNGNNTLAEGRTIDFVQRNVVNRYFIYIGWQRVKETEEKEN